MVKTKIKRKEKPAVEGIWYFHEFNVKQFKHLSEEELEKAFVEAWRAHKEGKSAFKYPFGLQPKKSKKYNLVMNGLLDTIIHRMIGTATGTEDLQARKLAVGTSNETPVVTQTELGNEVYRASFTEAAQYDNTAQFVVYINRTTANGYSTEAVTDVSNSTTNFLLEPGEAVNFQVGEQIRVTTTSGFNFTTITAVDVVSNRLTVSPPLLDVPETGDQVVQAWAEAGIFGNANAGVTAGSGTMFNRVADLQFVKDEENIILIQVEFIFTVSA